MLIIRSVLCCVLTIFMSFYASSEINFTVAYENKTQFPFYIGNTTQILDNPGAAVELVKMLEEQIPGLHVNFVRCPWKRCLSYLRAGSVDAIFNASFNESRLSIGAYPLKNGVVDPDKRITTIAYSLYSIAASTKMHWNGKEFGINAGLVGAPLGYSIVEDLKERGINVVEINKSEQALYMLVHKRVNMVALQEVTGDYLIKTVRDFADVKKIEPPFKSKEYYLMISHQFEDQNPVLAERIWQEIGFLRESKLLLLMQKYF